MPSLADFHCQISGPEQGRRWVFLHGLMGFSNNWGKIIAALKDTERCLTYDQRGHGRSIKPATGYGPEDYGNDLLEILNQLGWDKIILVGHSMGGRNAFSFASRFPERVEKLVIEDISPAVNNDNLPYYENLLGHIPTPFSTREEARKFLMEDFVKTAKTKERADILAQFFYANMEEKSPGVVDWRFSKNAILESVRAAHQHDYWVEIQSLSMPTLVIRGADSKELSRENFEKMLAANKMMKGVEITSAGHWVHSDQPQAVILALKKFAGLA
jgi:esterase